MNDIWSIIGLSSLIASIVTVILGIVRDVLVEKHRFRRQSEAGYIQSQIQIYSRIYFLLQRLEKGASIAELFGDTVENMKELNKIIGKNSSLMEPKIVNEWLGMMAFSQKFMKEKKVTKKRTEYAKQMRKHSKSIREIIKTRMNNNLIPKYRKIVGETVPSLE